MSTSSQPFPHHSSLFEEYLHCALPFSQEFDRPAETSMYFGFTPIQTPRVSRGDRHSCRNLQSFDRTAFPCAPEEKISLLRLYVDHGLHHFPHPILLHYRRPRNLPGTSSPGKGRHLGLDIIGSHRSVADALAIKTAVAILEEEGFQDLIVDINSLGDADSMQRFEQALTQFYRDRINQIPPKYHPILKHDIFDMLQFTEDELCRRINCEAPQAVSYLSENNRRHFMDILEYLEKLGVPYRVSNTVLGNRHISSQTVFTIRHINANGTEQIVANGTRYNRLARKTRFNRDIQAVGVSLSYTPRQTRSKHRKTPLKPRHFFAHLGDTARRKSLAIIDWLRRGRIPVHHSLINHDIRGQLARAEKLKMPYIIIMGQKEAAEDTVVVRNTTTMAQETVPTDRLVEYLRRYTK